jgi:alkylated DNA repair dioxygenase AlkB
MSVTGTTNHFVGPLQLEHHALANDAVVEYACAFLDPSFTGPLFQEIMDYVGWEQSYLKMRGEQIPIPRLQAWMSDPGVQASLYQKQPAKPWCAGVLLVKNKLEELTGAQFDYVLINLYRNGSDSIAYHSDSEAVGDGKNVICGVSLGGTRKFVMQHNEWKTRRIQNKAFVCRDGSLVTMIGNATQRYWKHSIPKTSAPCCPRISLTFRHS